MSRKTAKKYYLSRRSKIINNFDKKINTFRNVLLQQLGRPKTEIILKKIRSEYELLIPDILHIEGNKSFLTREFKDISIALAFVKVMKQYEYSREEIAVFICELHKEVFNSASKGNLIFMRFLFKILHNFPVNRIYGKVIKKFEKRARKGKNSSNIQMEYIKGDGIDFDYGVDILNCPICDLWRKYEAMDILPYVCLFDFFKSAMTGSGLIRTMTLSEGREKCDNRFKRGRKPQNRQKTQFITRESLSK